MLKDRMGNQLSASQATQKAVNRGFSLLLDLELYFLYLIGLVPFHSIRLFIYRLAGMSIGPGSAVHMWARFFYPPNISIGEDSIIGDHAFLDGRAKLVIGSHVDIASEVRIYNSEHEINSPDFHAIEAPVIIGDYVFIGPRVTLMPGITIGKGVIIAGGAVVTKDVAEFTIVGGVPAKVIGERQNKTPNYRLGRARLFQ